MINIDEEIRSKLEAFAIDLTALVRRAAVEAVATALGGAAAAAPGVVKRGRGRPRKVAAPAPVAKVKASGRRAKAAPAAKGGSKKAARARAPGEKRPPAELAKLTGKLGDYIKANPGRRMEAIGKALG